MEYQKIINLLDNTSNQLSKFRTKSWIEINDQSRGVYNTNSDIRFKTTMLKSSLYYYSDAYILVKGTITITGAGADNATRQVDERNKGVIFNNCTPLINTFMRSKSMDWFLYDNGLRHERVNCKSKINNTETDNAKDIDIVMPMYNLIEYSNSYSKTSGRLWQYYNNKPNDNLADSERFKSKVKITGNTPANGNAKNVEMIVPLKYLSNFWRTLEMT